MSQRPLSPPPSSYPPVSLFVSQLALEPNGELRIAQKNWFWQHGDNSLELWQIRKN